MLGSDLVKVERAVLYAAIEILRGENIPEDLWAVVIDAAAGQVKDYAMTAIALESLDWRAKAIGKEADDAGDD